MKNFGVHALVGQSADLLAGQAGDKVDPVGISARGANLANLIHIQPELATHFK